MPGVTIVRADAPAPPSVPSDTGKWFIAGLTEKGSVTEPILIRSLAEFKTKCGSRVSYSVVYDALEAFFQEGGSTAYLARVVGPTPVAAKVDLNNASAAATLRISAKNPGAWGNSLTVAVSAGVTAGTFILTIADATGTLQVSPELADEAAAVAWSATSPYVTCSDLAGTGAPAVVSAQALTGGTDDRSNIVTAQWTAALAVLDAELGAGQVSAPGVTTSAIQAAVQLHASTCNRTALLDGIDTTDSSALSSQATGLQANTGARVSGLFAPWAVIPGITPDTTRDCPWSAIQAGILARNDGIGTPPRVNQPGAGDQGVSRFALALKASFGRSTRDTLNAAGVTVARSYAGTLRTYGERTLASPSTDSGWLQLANSRLFMYVQAKAQEVGEHFLFNVLDPKKVTVTRFGGELEAQILKPLLDDGQLFSYSVDLSGNTTVTAAARQLVAAINLKASAAAEDVTITIVKENL